MILSKQIKKSTLLSILVLVSVSLTAIPGSGPILVSAAKGNTAIRSRTSSAKLSVRSVNKRSLQVPKETLKETRCKFLKPSGKGAAKPLENTAARRRRARSRKLAAPDVQFQEQLAEKVFIDVKIVAPAATNPPGKGKGTPPPPGMKWDYGSDGKDSNFNYEFCETPSAQPSLSPRPSAKPSLSPSRRPSNQPSPSPSSTPSISHQPTISMQPSVSAKPSNSPTMSYSDGCDNLENGGYKGDNTTSIFKYEPGQGQGNVPEYGVYEYQLVTSRSATSADMDTILADIDDTLQGILVDKLIWCGKTRRRLMEAADPHNVIDGIDLEGIDDLDSGKECTLSRDIPKEYKCEVYKGKFTIWARTNYQLYINERVLEEIMKEMTGFIADDGARQDLSTKIANVLYIEYGGGKQVTTNPNGIVAGAEDPKVGGAQNVSAMGVAIASGFAFVAFLFVFAAVRKRKHHKLSTVEEVVEDDQSLFGKSAKGTDLMSNGSNHWRNQRGAHVLGEEDSVYSVDFDSDDIVADIRVAESSRLYGMGISRQLGPQEDNLGGKGDALNVHTCTSATCPICNGTQSPTFVDTHTGNILSPIEEVSASREEGTPANVHRPITPSYSDTVDMDMAERNYQSPDTVEF
jgi:hypothetical protein